MPNWVRNQIRLSGSEEQIRALLEAVKSDEYGLGTVDFNKIIPMPPELNIESGSREQRGLAAYKDFVEIYTLSGTINTDRVLNVPREAEAAFLMKRTDVKPEEFALGKQAYQNIQKHGAPDWYDWCNKNWGTKWNACGYCPGTDYSQSDCLEFDTAWSAAVSVIREMSEMFPEVELEHLYADEDMGHNCGRITYKGGSITEQTEPYGDEALELANSLWGFSDDGITMG